MNTIYKNTIEVEKNSFHDEGDGIVSFPHGLVISDSEIQRNGTRYDIDTLDITKYGGQLTADHEDKLQNIIGRVEGVKKNGGKVTVDRIVYAVKENPLARLAYDLLKGGFSKAFSTETMGISNTVDGTLANHELVGLSQVVVPNNYSACINSLKKSLNQAKADGLDVSGIEEKILNGETSMNESEEVKAPEVEEVETPAVEETEQAPEAEPVEAPEEVENSAKEEAEEPEEAKEEESKEEKSDKEEAKEEESGEEAEEGKEENEAEEVEEGDIEKVENEISDEEVDELFNKLDALTALVQGAVEDKPTEDVIAEQIVEEATNSAEQETEIKKETNSMDKEELLEVLKNYFGEKAEAPEFKKVENKAEATDFASMDWKERYNKQVAAAYDGFRMNSIDARKTLNEINKANFAALKEAGIAKNSMTIESMGNFVLPPEMYREIIGTRSDYSALLDATDWRETDRLEFAFLRRNGDISMKNVAMCDDGKDGNLKPISEYEAEPVTEKLEELAAVTVVCTAATRFYAVDLLGDVAAGYRNDYDRKRAQLVVAKLEQAVKETGNEVAYEASSDTKAMIAWLEAMAKISDTTTEGILIFNSKTFAKLKAHALEAGVNGPLSDLFTNGEIPRIFGMKYIVVPNDLLPTIESEDEVAFEVQGEEVPITHAVFYGDLSQFVGYTSGGLQYDISADASYENGGVVKSAYQRNELVLRGSFFRGGAVKDPSRIAGIAQGEIES